MLDPGNENKVSLALDIEIDEDLWDSRCSVIATYKNLQQFMHAYQTSFDLPILNFFKLVAPIKEARTCRGCFLPPFVQGTGYKFTFETNLEGLTLKDLFQDVLEDQSYRHASESSILTFRSKSDVCITMTSKRTWFWIQSDVLYSILPFVLELEARIMLLNEQIHPNDHCVFKLKAHLTSL